MESMYFSFMGYAKAHEISLTPSVGKSMYKLGGVDAGWCIDMYHSKTQKNLLFLRRIVWINCGDHDEKQTTWYSILKDSWVIEPAVPVRKYADDLEAALSR